MKIFFNQKTAVLLLSTFAFLTFGFGAAAQEKNRERVIIGATPTPQSSPKVSPSATPSPAPTIIPVQSLTDLQSKIRLALARPELQRGSVGVKIAALDTEKTVFEANAEKYLMPASNMKSFTIAAALERLSPNFRFVTSVYASAMPDANGAIKGDLRIFGRGDISISFDFYNDDYYKGLDALADKIAQSGIKRVEGNLVADETYFTGSPLPPGWEWDDLQWNSGAEVSALPINNNVLNLFVKQSSVNAPCAVQLLPVNTIMRVINRCTTTNAGAVKDLTVKKDLDQNVVEISGTMPVGDKGFANYLTVSHPSELFIQLLRQRLELKGVTIIGQTKVFSEKDKPATANFSAAPPIEIAKLESFPLSIIAAKTMKPSQNMFAETILRALGEQAKTLNLTNIPADNPLNNPKTSSNDKGLFAVQNFTNQIGIPADGVLQYDGCGLSRHDLVTANALVKLYSYMGKQSRYAQTWRDSLPVGGVDGTLKSRFATAPTAGNVHAKTGTIDQVSALSGYVTTAAGEQMVFSIIVNGVPASKSRTSAIDEIVTALANFNGKLN